MRDKKRSNIKLQYTKNNNINNKVSIVWKDKLSDNQANLITTYIIQLLPLVNLKKTVRINVNNYKDDEVDFLVLPQFYDIKVKNDKYFLFNIVFCLFGIDLLKGEEIGKTYRGICLETIGATVAFLKKVATYEHVKVESLLPSDIISMLEFDQNKSNDEIELYGRPIYKGEITEYVRFEKDYYRI